MQAVVVAHAAIRAANRRTYRALAARGVDVTVVVPHAWRTAFGELVAEPEPAGSPLHVVVRRRLGISHSNAYCLAGSLAGLARGGGSTAFYVDEDPAGFVAAQAAAAARHLKAGLVVLAIQNIVKRYPPPFAWLQRFVFARAHVAVSISDAAAQTLRERGFAGPTTPMPFSTDVRPLDAEERARVRTAYALRGQLVGYVGRLVPEKGIDNLLDALARLPDVRGVIVGDGPEREMLMARAEALGIASRVTFTGAVPSLDAIRLIGSLDVLALPSRAFRNWSEQFGRVLIEAMASGVPVVASDSGAIGEVVGDAGLLVPEDDPAQLAVALATALETRSAEMLRARGRQRVAARFAPEIETGALHDALLLAAQGGTR